jgi:hypothetical protein
MLKRLSEMASRSQSLGELTLDSRIQEMTATLRMLHREAHQPVRVGLVGAFNAGKTRLLEALLGCAGRLNVVDRPSTGNIVEFELRVGDVAETQLEGWKVLIMSELNDAGRVLKRLLAEARDKQSKESYGQQGDSDLHQLLFDAEFAEGERPRWAKAQEWAVRAHAKARAKQFKAVAFEVYRLAYTVGRAVPWLGREFELSETGAIQLMSLDYDPHEVYQRELKQWQMPVPQVPAGNTLVGVPRADLKGLFPIVRKIIVKATLPAFVAEPFGGPTAVDVRLVDCPGAGADGSNFRDSVLCAQELKDVDTVFALLNAKNPGENREFIDELLRIWGPAAKDRILAVVSRFDELPHDKNVSAGKRDAFAHGSGPLAAEQVLKEIDTLATVLKAAADTVIDRETDYICFVTAMGYLSERLEEEKGVNRRGTDDFYKRELGFDPVAPSRNPRWDQRHHAWVCEMERWYQVSRRLRAAADKDSVALGDLLNDFASDGGFTRLHRTLQTHLSEHGQANKLARLMPERYQAEKVVNELEEALAKAEKDKAVAPPSPPTPAECLSWTEALTKLKHVYERHVDQPLELVRRPPGSLTPTPLRDPIRRWTISRICAWWQWRLLLIRIQADQEPGLVKLVDPSDPELAAYPAALKDERDTPVRSDQFQQPFTDTLADVYTELRKRCEQAMQYHGEELLRKVQQELGGTAGVERIRAITGEPPDGATELLEQALDPLSALSASGWLDKLLPPLAKPDDADQCFERYFPLQHGEPGKPLYYAWHKPLFQSHAKQFDRRHRHLMYVIKLRQVLIDAALVWLDDAIHTVRRGLERALADHVKRLAGQLRTAVEKFPIQAPSGPAD